MLKTQEKILLLDRQLDLERQKLDLEVVAQDHAEKIVEVLHQKLTELLNRPVPRPRRPILGRTQRALSPRG
jgi:chaperonin GroEL (HSP60 family)